MKCIMRNLCKYILATVTLAVSALSFGSVALAQAVHYDKYVSGPNEDGIFTLNLEAYATGSVSVVTKPFDIILVLDRSGSMKYNMAGSSGGYWGIDPEDQRINILKAAIKRFVDNVKNSNVDSEYKDAYGGHRIAFVWFSGQSEDDNNAVYTRITGLNQFQNVEDLTTYEASGTDDDYQAARILLNNNYRLDMLGVDPDGGTFSNKGMERANTILSGQNYSDKPNRKRLVVFFTDGEPGSFGWNGYHDYYNDPYYQREAVRVANGCISAAYDIKNEPAYKATVYSVGLFNMTAGANRTTTYLSYTSSDFSDKTEMPSSSNQYVPVSNDKSIIVSSASSLNNIFTSISQNTSDAASGSSVLVDIVASNFKIPTNTSLGSVKVWEVPCTQQSATSFISFSPRNATGALAWTNITDDVDLDLTKQAQGEVSVKGFDYGAKWCGWDATANNNQGAAHGSKLVLEIPISANDDIVGGPSLETNLPGSGITVKDKDGNIIEEHQFISPVVKVPVTIWIKKEGLLSSTKNSAVQGHEDNAVFTIRKTKFLGLYETDANGNEIEGGKRIDYTYNNSTEYTIKGVKTKLTWTTFTKVSVNMKEGAQDGIVKISGLDPDYIYRIEEDAWAHLGYNFDPDATARYTLEWDEAAGHYKDISNPFVFSNTPKTNAFYSEDVVRNVFNPGSAAPTP